MFEKIEWKFMGIDKLVRESTLSGNAGGGFPMPFMFGDEGKKKREYPLLRPAMISPEEYEEEPSEEAKIWRNYLGK